MTVPAYPVTPARVVGVILAGGLSRRMGGGDKCLRLLGSRPILTHVVARVRGQVGRLVLNANGDPQRFADFHLPVAADSIADYAGPLAGVLTGMDWARDNAPDCPYVASFAADAPFPPRDLVPRFLAAVEGDKADLACARSGHQDHPVVGLWPVRLADELRRALAEGLRKVDIWTARYRLARVEFPVAPVDPFFNANTPQDLAEAELLLPFAG